MKRWSTRFEMDPRNTCKQHWTFHLMERDSGDLMIESVEIDAGVNEQGREVGCKGHPKTIMALLRNIPVSSLPLDLLESATCAREQSCGMNLAACIRTILSEPGPVR